MITTHVQAAWGQNMAYRTLWNKPQFFVLSIWRAFIFLKRQVKK